MMTPTVYPTPKTNFAARYASPPSPEAFLKDFAEVSDAYDRHMMERESVQDFKDKIEAKKPRGKSPGWLLGGILFPTKEAVLDCYRNLRLRWRPGEYITGPDADFLRDLVMTHEWIEDKIGVGIKDFFVTHNFDQIRGDDTRGNRVVGFERWDGTWDDFGMDWLCRRVGHVAVKTPEHQLHYYKRWRVSLLSQAMRQAISPQIDEFKASKMQRDGTWTCEVSGEVLLRGQAHVDHAPEAVFHKLVGDFMRATGWGVTQFDVVEQFGSNTVFVHRYDIEQWASYHREFAKLRIVKDKVNSKGGSWGVSVEDVPWDNLPGAAPWEGGARVQLLPDFRARTIDEVAT